MDPKGSIEKLNNTSAQKVNILMVDDHPENLLALEAVLTSPNYNLISAHSGKEALKCMLQHDFAVILLDVQMPGLNGFDTAKLIKAREKTKISQSFLLQRLVKIWNMFIKDTPLVRSIIFSNPLRRKH